MLITQKAVEKLKPGKNRLQFMDDELTGLGIRVQQDGEKSFFWSARIRGVLRFKKIGTFPAISAEEARMDARKLIGIASAWKRDGYPDPDPFAKAPKIDPSSRQTFRQLFEGYIVGQVRPEANHPEKAEAELRWKLQSHFNAWLDRPADSITVQDVISVKEACREKHTLANRAVQFIRTLYAWAAKSRNGQINFKAMDNPATSVTLYPEKPRERFLQADEMVRFEKALKTEPSQDLRDFLALSMATGARKSDVLGMRWVDIQWERKNWCVPFPKNGESYNASLEASEIAILERRRKEVPDSCQWVFPGPAKSGHLENVRKPWLAFRKRADIPDVKIHDLRRTVGSWQAIAGESLQKIGHSLGHKSPRSTQVYARLVDQAVRDSKAAGKSKMKELMAEAKRRAKKQKAQPESAGILLSR
jgi:integrase